MTMIPAGEHLINRELSWLEFNQRVLDHAGDARNPLLERLKFLAITSSNLDEFFMVRVGGLWLQHQQHAASTDSSGMTVSEQLHAVLARAHRLHEESYRILLADLEPQLRNAGIGRVREATATVVQRQAIETAFAEGAEKILSPQAVSLDQPFPLIPGLSMHLCVRLKPKAGSEVEWEFALIPMTRVLSRMVLLPTEYGVAFALLEEIVASRVATFFPGREVVECIAFRLTRNADMELREDQAPDLLVGMEDALESRRLGGFVRLEIDDHASEEVAKFLTTAARVGPEHVFRSPGPIDFSVLFSITNIEGFENLRDPAWPGQPHRAIDPAETMFTNIAQQDLLLVHPYEQYDSVVRLIEEAAIDPQVLSIKQVLYRTSRKSAIVAALERAAKHGKYVTVLVELKARFDEARNIEWARELELAGVQVIYGVRGLKTHAKVCIVVRREPHGLVRYCHFGTGNYNESTARLYSDISLLTCNDELAADGTAFFNAITGASQPRNMRHLVVAPIQLRRRLVELINGEKRRQKQGQRGFIMAKFNALVDPQLIGALYEASQAGVVILLNIRGVCCLRPGIPGISENIRVTSIVDRYLEHARILYFHHGGRPSLWISSADWMPRNMDRRVELLIPVHDDNCRKKLIETLETYFEDNTSSWELLPNGQYARQVLDGKPPFRSQQALHLRCMEAVKRARQAQRAMLQPHQPVQD